MTGRILQDYEKMQVSWFFHNEDFTIPDLALTYKTSTLEVYKATVKYKDWYDETEE